MAILSGVEASAERLEVVESVRPRLVDIAGADVDRFIETALDELTPASVTTYLPILVERRVRALVHQSPATPPV